MEIKEVLDSLERSWSRKEILKKIKNGEDSEKIIRDFFYINHIEILKLTNFIKPKDKILLEEIEHLSNCEAKLIQKIKNFNPKNNYLSDYNLYKKKNNTSKNNESFRIGHFMMKWSNKFVFILILIVSALALSKQAWA